jgi:hypothetical protein
VRNLSWVSLREASSASALRECSPYAELLPPRGNPSTDKENGGWGIRENRRKGKENNFWWKLYARSKKKEEQNQDSARSIEGVPQSQGNPEGNVLFWAGAEPWNSDALLFAVTSRLGFGSARRTGLKAGHHKSQEPCAGLDLNCTGRNEHE